MIDGFRYAAVGAYDTNYDTVSVEAINSGKVSTKDLKIAGYIIADTNSGAEVAMTVSETIVFADTNEKIRGLSTVNGETGKYIAKRWDKIYENMCIYESKFGLSTADINYSAQFRQLISTFKKPQQSQQSQLTLEELAKQINILKQQNIELYNQVNILTRKVEELSNQPAQQKSVQKSQKTGTLPINALL
jgi:hypothetical protein